MLGGYPKGINMKNEDKEEYGLVVVFLDSEGSQVSLHSLK